MKTLKPVLTAAMALCLLAACGKSLNRSVQHLDDALLLAPAQAPAGSGARRAAMPALKVGGRENPNVYLQSLDIQVEVTGNIASTRYTMVFKNRTAKILEANLTFPLPDGVSVTRYALDMDGRMRDAVPVDKDLAARVFEQIQRREVDPGLLERVQGNNFRTRIYPVPAGGTRTVSIGYEEELTHSDGALHYRLPMNYPAPIEKYTVTATVWKGGPKPLAPDSEDGLRFDMSGGNYAASLARENYRPGRALAFSLPAPAGIAQVMMQRAEGRRYFLASVTPDMNTRKKEWGDNLAVIWDVSLSGARRDLKRETDLLDIIFADKKNADVHLYFLNNRLNKSVNTNTENGGYKVTGGEWDSLKSVLENAVFDGGTDYSQIDLDSIAGDEILFFSDGLATLSDADFIKEAKVNRPIHCIVSSANADYGAMRLIAGKAMGKYINLNALSSEKLKEELLNETPQFLGAEHGDGIREVYPSIATPALGNFSVAGVSGADGAGLTLLFGFGGKVEKRVAVRLGAENETNRGNAHKIWVQKKIAELDLEYEKNLAEITALGTRFGIVTRNTSLLVLELIEDYVQFSIEPPASEPGLLAEYRSRMKEREERSRVPEYSLLDGAIAAAGSLKEWWNTDFPLPRPEEDLRISSPDFLKGGAFGEYGTLASGISGEEVAPQPKITVKPILQNNDYLKSLTGDLAGDYQSYLKLRDDYGNSPTFYFDAANWFYTRGGRETALRVLTSIADLDIENASLYRLLGYRFKEYGEHELQKFVCKKVMEWRPFEPQSYRDYALALADNGEAQAALDSLYAALTRTYPEKNAERAAGLDEVAVTEINRLIAKNPHLDISKIDKRLLISIPADIRVVMNWNMDNTKIEFYVVDPNGDECYAPRFYNQRRVADTHIGGRMSRDIYGYGPVQFLLKKAVKGKYQVYVRYYGRREFTDDGPVTVMAEFFTKYAGADEQKQAVCLQLAEAKRGEDGRIEVVEFEF